MANPCPHCGTTTRYTDPLLQVRCEGCLNPLNDEAAGTPIGSMQDLDAPYSFVSFTPPREDIHHGR